MKLELLDDWLVEGWRSAWKWMQTWLGAVITAAPILWDTEAVKTLLAMLPTGTSKLLVSALGIAVILNTLRRKPAA